MLDLGDIKKVTGAELAMVLADETELTLGPDRISMRGLVLDTSTSIDGQFTIGAAVTGQLTITLINDDDALSIYNFRDAELQLSFIGPTTIPDDEDEEVETDSAIIGTFNVADYIYDGSNIVLTTYDNLSKFDFPCTETNNVEVTFPITIENMVKKAAQICSVTLRDASAPIPNASYSITKQPEQWNTMTWHDVISYCAQLGGTYAKVDYLGRLYFDWYDLLDAIDNTSGGTFLTTTTPYSDGADVDGGSFDPWNTGDVLDGGTFSDYPDIHVIPSPYALTIDTDDVCITGLKVVLEAADNIEADENTDKYTTQLYGTAGYVITISGNPFIQTASNADSIASYLGYLVVGMRFRPLTSTIVENPAIEAGDCAYITGRNGSTYTCFISHVTYTTYAATVIVCDAEPNMYTLKTRFTSADKLNSSVTRIQKKLDSAYKIAGNTNQYFWTTETGTDTGAHITEVPQEEWNDSTSQNYHTGGNLLARTNGIAIRDGLTEMASFSSNGMVIGTEGNFRSIVESDGIRLMDPSDISGFSLRMSGNTAPKRMSQTMTIVPNNVYGFTAPIETSSITMVLSVGNSAMSTTKTSSEFPINGIISLSANDVIVSITRKSSDFFLVEPTWGNNATAQYGKFTVAYIGSVDVAKINFTGNNNILWEGSGVYLTSSQTVYLSESVTEQLTGVILAWCEYFDGTDHDSGWYYQFVPKYHVMNQHSGYMTSGVMTTGSYLGMKFVYVDSASVVGHDYNSQTRTVAGVSFTNSRWVLKKVLGV